MTNQDFTCGECGCATKHSFYRENENEPVCEGCWIEYLAKQTIRYKQFIDLTN